MASVPHSPRVTMSAVPPTASTSAASTRPEGRQPSEKAVHKMTRIGIMYWRMVAVAALLRAMAAK